MQFAKNIYFKKRYKQEIKQCINMKNAAKGTKATFIFFLIIIFFSFSINAYSQSNADTTESLTLPQCIDYALKHQPLLQQSLINVDITRSTNKISLAGWLPQAYVSGNFTHYLQLPSAVSDSTGGKVIKTGMQLFSVLLAFFTISNSYYRKVVLRLKTFRLVRG